MSKKKSQVPARIEVSKKWINAKMLFLTAAVILMVPVLVLGQLPDGYQISGYITYGGSGFSGVLVTAVGTGEFTGYLGLDFTDFLGYYNLPVPDGFAGTIEPSMDGYTFDPVSRFYSNVESDQPNQNFAASNGGPPPPPPSIIVESPNGGESWQRGTSYNINWNSFGSVGSDVRIELFKGGVLNLKITSSTDNDGSYVWSIPSDRAVDSDYKIKITSTTNSAYYDYSNDNFSIIDKPLITVTSPNGGESWQRGSSQNITWDSVGNVGSNVRIDLYKGGVLSLKIISSTENNGSYDWSIPLDQTIDSDYKIKIASASNPTVFDESDDFFSIDEVSPVIFEDTFISLKIDFEKWTVIDGVIVDDTGIDEPSPEYSLRLNGHPTGGDLIESVVIDLSSYSDAALTYYYQRTGAGNSPEQGEDLVIEYHNGSSWVELNRQPGDGPDMDYYQEVVIPLPPGAFHAGFQLRIQNKGTLHESQKYDDWYVDDVKIEVTAEEEEDNIVYPAKLIPGDSDTGDWFGRRVSISGKYAIVGALHDNDDRGSAYIFERSAADWIQQTKLTASSPAAGDQFGSDVSISGDNAIVGADRSDYNGSWSGAAYVFQRTNTGWIQQDMLVPSDGNIGDRFGNSVSISGNYLIIGAYWDDDNGFNSGSAYVFRKDVAGWVLETKLRASDGAKDDWFGHDVSIDGNYAIVGAVLDNHDGAYRGSAYIFRRDGSNWIQQTKLVAEDGQAGDEFGGSVSIRGNYAVIGAIGNDDAGEDAGAAYIFVRSGNNWIQQAKLVPLDGAAGDHFGNSVSIDGNYAIVAAHLDADMGTESGSAYIFKREGQSWAQQAKLSAPDGSSNDFFGQGVSIDSSYVVIGAPYNDDNGDNSGSVYIFRRIGTTWMP